MVVEADVVVASAVCDGGSGVGMTPGDLVMAL